MKPATLPEWFAHIKQAYPEVAAGYRIKDLITLSDRAGSEQMADARIVLFSELNLLAARLWVLMAAQWQFLNNVTNMALETNMETSDRDHQQCSELSFVLTSLAPFVDRNIIAGLNENLLLYFDRCQF